MAIRWPTKPEQDAALVWISVAAMLYHAAGGAYQAAVVWLVIGAVSALTFELGYGETLGNWQL